METALLISQLRPNAKVGGRYSWKMEEDRGRFTHKMEGDTLRGWRKMVLGRLRKKIEEDGLKQWFLKVAVENFHHSTDR